MVPAMIYLLGMPTKVVVGTSLFQIIFVTGFTAVLHAIQSGTVDVVLALILLVGGVIGAQIGVDARGPAEGRAAAHPARAAGARGLPQALRSTWCSSPRELYSLAVLLTGCGGWRALLLALSLAAAAGGAGDAWSPAISTDNIALTANFNGSELFVFGAVRRDAPIRRGGAARRHHHRQGPAADGEVRRKERRFGIWVNTERVTVRQAPSFYAVATTAPARRDPERDRAAAPPHRHGPGGATVGGQRSIADTTVFTDALVRLRERTGSTSSSRARWRSPRRRCSRPGSTCRPTSSRATMHAQFFLVRDSKVIALGRHHDPGRRRPGIERWLYNLSRSQPLLYGLDVGGCSRSPPAGSPSTAFRLVAAVDPGAPRRRTAGQSARLERQRGSPAPARGPRPRAARSAAPARSGSPRAAAPRRG